METRAYINQSYGQPALTHPAAPPTTVVLNQKAPNPRMFKTTPVALNCLFCKRPITTTVITKCNCCACLLCWLTGLLLYVCIQCCRDKDICCYDAEHRCPHCGNVVGTYTAC